MSRNCFVAGCKSGYKTAVKLNKELGLKNPSLFYAPKNEEMLEKWRRAIPRKDPILEPKHRVCDLHFEEDCIIRYFTTVCKDGSISSIERERPILKPDAVPTKFPNCPTYLPQNTRKHKAPADSLVSNMKGSIDNDTESIEEMDCDQPDNSFADILQNICKINMPEGWFQSYTKNIIFLGKLNKDHQCERHITISEDLCTKIFMYNKEIKCIAPATSIDQINDILLIVDSLPVCKEFPSWQKNCMAFVEDHSNGSADLFRECNNAKTKVTAQKKNSLLKLAQKNIKVALLKNMQ